MADVAYVSCVRIERQGGPQRLEAERVHGFHARFCPVARSIAGAIDVVDARERIWCCVSS
jgi:hypothetical protein